jgi:hypothetical protein
MKRIDASHLDHGLTEPQISHIMATFAGRDAFFIETIELPEELGMVDCGLHGPLMGDDPVGDDECELVRRGDRPNLSRLCDRQPRPTRQVTVIAGPHGDDPCVLYTAFGGPVAEKEVGDPTLTDDDAIAKSAAFWAEHALSR